VAYFPPTFSMVEIFARMNGMVPRPLPAGEGANAEARALANAEVGAPAVIYLCRPNNPTGECAPREVVEELLRAGGEEGPVLLLDEAYADFADDDFLREAASSPRLLVVRTLSKAYGLAGLRVGFAVGSSDVIAEVEKSRGPYKVSRLAERAAVAALVDAEGWVPEIVRKVREGREGLRSALEARGLSPLPSQANFLLLPLGDVGGGSRTAASVTTALREHGVAVRPFPALPGLGETIRISIGPPEELDRFTAALDAVLQGDVR
jgi:histidinol-phosphate/aromatic aminotransferase/cobyric acid decarboxylase-like protein